MGRTYRRPTPARRSARNKPGALTPPEKRRLIQLGVSIGLFLLVFAGRGLFPVQTAEWKRLLGQDTDFQGVFSRLGAAVSQGEPVLETLGELWVEVFAGEPVSEGVPDRPWDWAPAFSYRMARQLARPQDAVGQWSQRQAEQILSAVEGEQKAAPEGTRTAQQDGEALPASTLGVQTAEHAVAQAYTQDGLPLPPSVSLAFYELGLEKTVHPVKGTLTSDYGYRDHPISGDWHFHRGVDLGAPMGTAIRAFADGTVSFAGENDSYGLYLKIDHGNGATTLYAHCSCLDVEEGQTVSAGEQIALVGDTGVATGPHLHFSVIKDGVWLDPLYYVRVG